MSSNLTPSASVEAGRWRLHGVVAGWIRKASFWDYHPENSQLMDVKLNTAIIKSERRKRGWSQEQLAVAAGLSVRTIQRIESSGGASAESAKCLAAVFEVPLAGLVIEPGSPPARGQARWWAAVATLFVVVASSTLFISRANATDIAMAVVLVTETSGVSRMNVEVHSGRQTEVRLENDIRLLLTPTIRADGTILVDVELYGWDGAGFTLAGKPRLVMRQGVETRLRLGMHSGRTASISIIPKAI